MFTVPAPVKLTVEPSPQEKFDANWIAAKENGLRRRAVGDIGCIHGEGDIWRDRNGTGKAGTAFTIFDDSDLAAAERDGVRSLSQEHSAVGRDSASDNSCADNRSRSKGGAVTAKGVGIAEAEDARSRSMLTFQKPWYAEPAVAPLASQTVPAPVTLITALGLPVRTALLI